MNEPTKRASAGGSEREHAYPLAPHSTQDRPPIPDRAPRVLRRRGDPEYHLRFAVAGRSYFGPTGHTDLARAHAHAMAAHAIVVANQYRRFLKATGA